MDLYSLLGIQSVADVVRHGRLRWFGHLECESVNDWVLACRNVEVAGVRCRGRNRRHGSAWFAARVSSIQGYVEGLQMGKRLTLGSLAWKKWTFSKYYMMMKMRMR